MNELEVEETLRNDPEVSMGVAAPYEPSPDLDYHELFAMSWSLITPPRHPLVGKRRVRLQDLADQPLIIYERGSTGRQHILDAFHESGLSPQVALETTSTETIVSMVEAGTRHLDRAAAAERRGDARAARTRARARGRDPSHPLGRARAPRREAVGLIGRAFSISSDRIFRSRRGSVAASTKGD